MTTLHFLGYVAAFFLGIAFGWIGGRVRQRRQARDLVRFINDVTAPETQRMIRDELDAGEGYGRGRDDA